MKEDKYLIKFTFLNIVNFIFLIVAFLSFILIIGISSDYDFENFNRNNLGSLFIFIPILGIVTYTIYFQQTGKNNEVIEKIKKITWIFGIINSSIWVVLTVVFIFKLFIELNFKSKNVDSYIVFI